MGEQFPLNFEGPGESRYERMSTPMLKAEYQRVFGARPGNLTGNEEVGRKILITALENPDEETSRLRKIAEEEDLRRRRLEELEENRKEIEDTYRRKRQG